MVRKVMKKIKHSIRLSGLYLRSRLLNIKYKTPEVIDDIQTLDLLIKDNKSIARFGDGEIALINSMDIKFQKADVQLKERLKEILYTEDDGILIGIPDIFTLKSMKKLTYESKLFWQHELIDRQQIWYSIPKNKVYYDACITRPYIRNVDNRHSSILFDKLKQVWNGRKVVIVEGQYSRLGLGNDLFSNTEDLKRILCPSKDAFCKYDQIMENVLKVDKNTLILLSLGPTATVLAYDLYKQGYQVIDLGHIDLEYEWFLSGSKKRVPIKNKSVNELDNNAQIDDFVSQKFEEQVVDRVL